MANGDMTTQEIQECEQESIDRQEDSLQNQLDAIADEFALLGEETSLVHVGEYVRRHKSIEAAIEETKRQYKIIIQQYKVRLAALNRVMTEDISNHVEGLIASGRKRSIDTLHGRTGFRSSKGTVRVVDEEAFMEWMHSQPDTIRERMTDCIQAKVVRTTSIRHYIEETAEIPLGIAYTPPGDNFYPSMKKEDIDATESNDR